MLAELAIQPTGFRALIQGQQLLAARLCQLVPHWCSYGTPVVHYGGSTSPLDATEDRKHSEDEPKPLVEPLEFFSDPPEKEEHLPPVVLSYRNQDSSKQLQSNEVLLGAVVRRRVPLNQVHAERLQSIPAASNKWKTGYSPIEAEKAWSKHEVQVRDGLLLYSPG
jgi:hypothetical protein